MLLVHAHPDDESLWTGGTMAHYAAAGVEVTLVTCTLGEEGEVIPPRLHGLAAGAADQLGGYRVGELERACAALGVAEHRYLGGMGRWRDSGMVGTEPNGHPRAFATGPLAEQVDALAAILDEVRPQVVVSYDSFGGYGHPDHIRAHEVTMAATGANGSQPGRAAGAVYWVVAGESAVRDGLAALATAGDLPYRMPAAGELPSVADDAVTTTVDISGSLPAKLAALREHETQVTVWAGSGGQLAYVLSDQVARPLREVEQFTLVGGQADPAVVRTDLFGWLDR